MSFHSCVFCAESELRSPTAVSSAASGGLGEPACAARRPSTASNWLVGTAGLPAAAAAAAAEEEAWFWCERDCGVEKDAMERMVAGDDVAEDG